MRETPHLNEALGRLRSAFRGTAGTELTDADIAELAGLEEEECRVLLGVLLETGAIEQRRRRVFTCRPSMWTAAVRS